MRFQPFKVYNHTGSVVMGQQTNTSWVQEPRPDMTAPAPVTLTVTEFLILHSLAQRPGVVKSPADEGYCCVIMPMRI